MAKEKNEKEVYDLFNESDEKQDFYNESEIGLLLEDDEISDEEEAFMVGYMDYEEE